jgi:hypothetical protein
MARRSAKRKWRRPARRSAGPYPPFEVPEPVRAGWDARKRGASVERKWNKLFASYEREHGGLAAEFKRRTSGTLPADFATRTETLVRELAGKAETVATRRASQLVLEALLPALPELVGGSADLTGSNLTMVKASKVVGKEGGGNYVFYGVREFGMCAVMNGLALHGGVIPYGGTFLVFSDYARNALRMAALMRLRVVYVFSHDSIGLGRGRADASADRARGEPAAHSQSRRLAAVRHGGDRGRVGGGARAKGRPIGLAAFAPGLAVRDARVDQRRAARRLCPFGHALGRGRADRNRLRGAARPCRAEDPRR